MPRPQDHYGKKAKAEGYPARSVFKLKELLHKFRVLPVGARVLDLGAAPGSFSLYLLEQLKGRGKVVAVDLAPRIEVPETYDNFSYIVGDLFENDTRDRIAADGPFDLVISDAAPKTSGQKEVDALRSLSLVESVLEIARLCLKPGGSLVVKIFQGAGEQEYFKELKRYFLTVKGFKPQASRRESFETYFVGIGFKGTAASDRA
ncbi:MAG TPA: RlmE family RNA methyltransferase [Spirochaetia bacterium]|nr:RlmE family RNA methyltransferase [Spirochaetia bacterium]